MSSLLCWVHCLVCLMRSLVPFNPKHNGQGCDHSIVQKREMILMGKGRGFGVSWHIGTYSHITLQCRTCSHHWWYWCLQALATSVVQHQIQCLSAAQQLEWDSNCPQFQWHFSKSQSETLLALCHCQPQQAVVLHLPKWYQAQKPKSVTKQKKNNSDHQIRSPGIVFYLLL